MPGRGSYKYDAVVVGAGPNGLAAAVTLARAGCSVLVLEAGETVGGGCRSGELTLPGFVHDICSAIHPLGAGSPFFRTLPLAQHGLEWVYPPSQLAHPFDDGPPAVLERSVEATARTLGPDASNYARLMAPLVRDWDLLAPSLLGPLRLPMNPLALGALARFGVEAVLPARLLAQIAFRGEWARGFFAGMSAHSILPLERMPSAAFGLLLGALGHKVGWPLPLGGSQKIVDALDSYLRSMGGEIVTGVRVTALSQLPPARAILFDVTPRQLLRIAGDALPSGYRRQLSRFRYGQGVFKVDYALSSPVPWKAAECGRAATVHLGSTLEEVSASEQAVWHGRHAERPFVLVAQQSLFDKSRAPDGKHTLWAYCHVPHGSTEDMTGPIEAQIERFAPGFRDLVLARHTMNTVAMQDYNPNYIGGDINGGAQDLSQLFTRPTPRLDPYKAPGSNLYICSASTPPGGGVHGMCGYHAARSALRHMR